MVQQLESASGGSSKPPRSGNGGHSSGGGGGGGGSSHYTAPTSYSHVNTQTLQAYTASGPKTADVVKEVKQLKVEDIFPTTQEGMARQSWGDLFPEESAKVEAKALLNERGQKAEHTYKPRKTFEMTWDDYNALSERQRSAVDFNTMLIDARQKDLKGKAEPTEGQREIYDKAVTNMFGEEGGSDTYAPETMAVLRQIDFDGVGQDLDDFLGLKTAISARDLKSFDKPKESPATTVVRAALPEMLQPAAPPRVEANAVQQALATGTQQLASQLEKGNQLLRGFQVGAALDRNQDLAFFGAEPNEIHKLPPGYGDTEKDVYFQKAFTTLAYKQNEGQLGDVWNEIRSILGPTNEMDQFKKYIDTRTASDQSYGLDTSSGQFRTAEEYRRMLGMDKEGEG